MKRKLSTATLFIFIYLAVQLLPIPILFLFKREDQIEMSLTLTLISSLIGTIIMLVMNFKKEWTPKNVITDGKSASFGKIMLLGVGGFVVALFIQVVTSIIEMYIFNIPNDSVNTEFLLDMTTQYPLLIFSIVLFAPIMEEFVFRKAIFSQLVSSKVGVVGSAVISSLIFALVHFDGHMLVYGTLGLWFCYLYYKTNNILTPMLAHGLMNAFVSLPVFFPDVFL